jgi:hypothetical protein
MWTDKGCAVQRRESTARSGGVKSQQLLTEGEIFEDEILSRTESTDNPAQEMPEGHDHGKNLIPTSQIELLVKLLIMRVFDLLANDKADMLKDLGCELAQGYQHSKPVPSETIDQLLSNNRAAGVSARRGKAASSTFS